MSITCDISILYKLSFVIYVEIVVHYFLLLTFRAQRETTDGRKMDQADTTRKGR